MRNYFKTYLNHLPVFMTTAHLKFEPKRRHDPGVVMLYYARLVWPIAAFECERTPRIKIKARLRVSIAHITTLYT